MGLWNVSIGLQWETVGYSNFDQGQALQLVIVSMDWVIFDPCHVVLIFFRNVGSPYLQFSARLLFEHCLSQLFFPGTYYIPTIP